MRKALAIGLLLFMSPANVLAQSRSENAHQRWIPVARPSDEQIGAILRGLGQDERTQTSTLPQFIQDGLKNIDPKTIEKHLSKLTPTQRQELQKLAQRFQSNNGLNGGLSPEDLQKSLSPELLDKLQNSEEIKKLAAEWNANKSSSPRSESQDPKIPKNLQEDSSDEDSVNLQNTDLPRINFDPSLPQSATPPDQSTNRNQTQSNLGRNSSRPNSSTNPLEGNASNPNWNIDSDSPGPSTNRANESIDKNQRSSTSGLAKDSSNTNPIPNSQRQRSPNRDATNRANNGPSASPGKSRNNSGASWQGDINREPWVAPQPQLSSIQKLRNKIQELGFGRALEKLTKEAVGIEQSRSQSSDPKDGLKGSMTQNQNFKETKPNRDTPQSVSRKDDSLTTPSQSQKTLDNREAFSQPNRSNQQASDSSIQIEPFSGQTSNSPSAPFEMPTLPEIPKLSFSFWHVVLALALIGLGICLLMLKRSPELLSKLTGRPLSSGSERDVPIFEIRNRAQVIQAFHQLIQFRIRSIEDWWTSRLVVAHADRNQWKDRDWIQTAATIYDRARYAPAHMELSESELESMRRAVRECSIVKGD